MERLLDIFNLLKLKYHYQANEIVTLFSLFKYVRLKKDTIFIEEGKICNVIGLLTKGLMKSSSVDSDGNHMVTRFIEDDGKGIIVNFESFTSRTPSIESLIAIEKSVALVISYDDFYANAMRFPNAEKIMMDLTKDLYLEAMDRIYELQRLSNKERIEKFLKEHGSLFNRVSKADIASYLNISRNQFTRLMKQIKK